VKRNTDYRLGLDLGGTKIEIAALGRDGRQRLRERIPAPRDDYSATLQAISGLVNGADAALGGRGTVGIGTPGAISPVSGLLRNSNSVWLNGKPLKADLEAVLGRTVRIANDANCFALSEATDGAARDGRVVFGVIIGTGTGAGVVVGGEVLTGPNAVAGEWGHNPLPWPRGEEIRGPRCYCGKRGCIETYLSGPGLSAAYERATGRTVDPRRVVEEAVMGNSAAESTLRIYEDRLARGLASAINLLDPDVIVLGGGMSNIQRLYN
jgi:fructokinase